MKSKWIKKDNLIFLILGISVFLAFTIGLFTGENGVFHLAHLKNTKDNLIAENKEIKVQNLLYQMEIKKLKELKTIAKEARRSLHLVEENEVVYIVSD